MKVILRPALNSDLANITGILRPWVDSDASILDLMENFVSDRPQNLNCEMAEVEKDVKCVSVWKQESSDHVRILAFGTGPEPSDQVAATGFLRRQITQWAEMGIKRASACIPETVASELAECFRTCGFMFEGIASDRGVDHKPDLRFCKHFLYRTIHHSEIIDFLRQTLVGLGYELRNEAEGFSYRVRAECRPPFSFGFWHRITRLGRDIIVHPPARVLEWHELENLFYPLQIYARHERPLLFHLEKKRAVELVELPITDDHQDTLFGTGISSITRPAFLPLDTIAVGDPAGAAGIRKGLSMLFYVNRIGAVGHARVGDWYMEDVKKLGHALHDVNEQDGADTGEPHPKSGNALVIRFHWYRAFKRPVKLDEIREMDDNFNPQHSRTIAPKLFRSILSRGNLQQ
jgi:hypothetical protein